jgi:ABC-type uncharacterized transport system permease subunit
MTDQPDTPPGEPDSTAAGQPPAADPAKRHTTNAARPDDEPTEAGAEAATTTSSTDKPSGDEPSTDRPSADEPAATPPPANAQPIGAERDTAAVGSGETKARPGLGTAISRAILNGNSAVITVLAIVLAFAIGAVLMVISDTDTMGKFGYFFASPGDSLSAAWHDISSGYSAMFKGSILDPSTLSGWQIWPVFQPICNTLANATPLIFGGLSVSLALRAGLFNIGGQGQIIMGAICAGYVGFSWHLPVVVALVVAIVAGIIGGAVWGGVVGVLRARTGAHEVICTIMLNYVASLFLGWVIFTKPFIQPNQVQPISKVVLPNARLPRIFGSHQLVTLALLLGLVAVVYYGWLMYRSKLGFELRAVGSNPDAARASGISVQRAQIYAMVLAGALMGLIGVSQILGTSFGTQPSLTPNVDNGFGVDAITVALLGRAKPVGILLASLLFGALRAASAQMQNVGIPDDIVTVIQALIVIFVAAPSLVREIFRLRGARGAAGAGEFAAKGANS